MRNFKELADYYETFSEPARLKIIYFLLGKKCECICHIAKHINKDQSVAFRHIMILKKAGVVCTKKHAKFLYCCLNNKAKMKKLLGEKI